LTPLGWCRDLRCFYSETNPSIRISRHDFTKL